MYIKLRIAGRNKRKTIANKGS